MIEFLENYISSKESSLECPVCFTVSSPPIYKCPREHIICSSCQPRLGNKCPTCRTRSGRFIGKQVYRQAEESWKELELFRSKISSIKTQNTIGLMIRVNRTE
eukprot:GFUD01102296.1.p1 GENE.GFUD01102296.1~~GFUD01102296.1.p1  ORF type:complete len:116 (+),score=29.01 GFUD01102296.1:42-350(+)